MRKPIRLQIISDKKRTIRELLDQDRFFEGIEELWEWLLQLDYEIKEMKRFVRETFEPYGFKFEEEEEEKEEEEERPARRCV